MAQVWGTIVSKDRDTQMRAGYEFTQSPATVTSSTGLVTVTVDIWLWTLNAMWNTATPLSWSGSFGSGSTTFNFRTYTNKSQWVSENKVKVRTMKRTVTASEAKAIVSTISASISFPGLMPSPAKVSGSWTTAKKPQSIFPPDPIVDPMTVTSMTADGTCVLNWTRVNPNDSSKPYTNIDIQMWTPTTGAYNALATLGNTYTYTIQRMVDFSLYRFRARPRNSAGSASAWAYSPFVYTEPDAPRNVKLKANADGTVTVTWDAPAKVPDTSYYAPKYEVVRRLNRGAWEYSLAQEVSTRSWTHTNVDPSVEYQYAVRTVGRTSPDVALYSLYTQSSYIRLSAPPLTPIINGPTEGQRFGQDFSLWWDHNPQDGSDQSGYELEWWTDKDTTVRKVSQTASAWNKVVIRPPQDNDWVRWRVRTKGVHPDFSPWTATQKVGVSSPPTVVLDTTPGPHWGTSPELRATWTYTDPVGHAATKYEVKTTDASGTVVQEYAGTTTAASGSVSWSGSVPRIEDGQTLTVSVRVADAHGVFSDWATATVTADYAEPPKPVVTATFDEVSGAAHVVVTVPPATGDTPPPEMIELFRYFGHGRWERVAVGSSATSLEWTDWSPYYGNGTHNLYMARAVSAYPSYTSSDIALLQANPLGCDQWFWLASVSVPERRVRLRGNPDVQDTAGIVRGFRRFYNDTFPTAFSTDMVDRTLNLSGSLDRQSSTWEDWMKTALTPGEHIYRDPYGRRLTVSLDPLDVHHPLPRFEEISVSMTVVESEDLDLWTDVATTQTLRESSGNLYELIEGAGVDLQERGVNLYELTTDPATTYFVEVGENVWAFVNADNPEKVW